MESWRKVGFIALIIAVSLVAIQLKCQPPEGMEVGRADNRVEYLQKRTNELLEEQNELLERIAEAVEDRRW